MARDVAFERNPDLERLLARLEGPLRAAERELLAGVEAAPRPILLVCACARAGATLLMQLLAASGRFGYPSNLISRFYAAPVLGALVQTMLFDPAHQFRDELALGAELGYTSDLGKTAGPLSPNEFYYFWRRWFPEIDGQPPGIADLGDVDFDELRAELAGLAGVFGKPLAFKASLLNRILPVIARDVPDSYVVFLRREPLFTAQSLLEARLRYSGSPDEWYSFRVPGYEELRALPPAAQVAAQVRRTEQAIAAGVAEVDPARVVHLTYEELCARPGRVWERLARSIAPHPWSGDVGPPPRTEPFPSGNVRRLPGATLAAIEGALQAAW